MRSPSGAGSRKPTACSACICAASTGATTGSRFGSRLSGSTIVGRRTQHRAERDASMITVYLLAPGVRVEVSRDGSEFRPHPLRQQLQFDGPAGTTDTQMVF